MQCVCVGQKTMKPLSRGAKISDPPACVEKQHNRRWTRLAVVDSGRERTTTPFIYASCARNEYVAIRNRVAGKTPQPTEEGRRKLREISEKMKQLLHPVQQLSATEFAKTYTGKRKERYLVGAEYYDTEGVNRIDAAIKCFVKDEKNIFNPAKPQPDPRAIQFRGVKYCVGVGRYLKPMEHQIYAMKGNGIDFPASRMIGKGLSSGGRAMLAVKKWKNFTDPVCLGLDATRFDQHCSAELLTFEHGIYTHMNNSKELARLLSYQLRNKGKTRNGLRYTVQGRRMSGDMNTALGNCVLMILMTAAFMKGRKYDVLDDGDDILLFIEREDLDWVLANAHSVFLDFGHVIKIESVAYSLEEILWCQSRVVNCYGNTWKFVRNPWKVMTNALAGVKWTTMKLEARRSMMRTIGLCELALNNGIPVLSVYAKMLIRHGGNSKLLENNALNNIGSLAQRMKNEINCSVKDLAKMREFEITDAARLSFYKAFHVSPDEQISLEHRIANMEIVMEGDIDVGRDIDVLTWTKKHNSEYPDVYMI